MIVQPGSSRVEMPAMAGTTPVPPIPGNNHHVLDLSANVPVDTWMANPDTDLLRAHRWKSMRAILFALGGVALAIVLVIVGRNLLVSDDDNRPIEWPYLDAAPLVKVTPVDAMEMDADDKGNIIAVSKFGYFSLAATAKTTIFIDELRIGETPLTRLPLKPGPHKVKAIGPRNKTKQFSIVIYGGKDTEAQTINW
jgi:hypothetical protein